MRRAAPALLLLCALLAGCVRSSREEAQKAHEKLKAYVLSAVPAQLSHKLNTDFDGKLKLVGAQIEPAGSLKPGQQVKMTLYWRCEKQLDSGWSLFTHVLDGSGERLLNLDNVGPLRDAKDGKKQALPPEWWQPGKIYADLQTFTVPASVNSERIKIVTGVWRNDERLEVTSGARDSENRATVASLSLQTAQHNKPRSTRVPELRADKLGSDVKIAIDGKLDEPAWKTAPSTGPFIDVRSAEANTTFPVNGSARLLWNARALFVAFEVTDNDVVGGFPKDEKDPKLWTKDTVELMIDPDGDGDNSDYYEIQINPQNLVFDSQFDRYNEPKQEPNGPFGHQEWSAELVSAVLVQGTLDKPDDQDKGYTVEAMIPWKSFGKAQKAPPELGDTWRMNFYAMQNNGGVAWSAILGQGNFHKASRFGRVLFAESGWQPPAPTPSAPRDPTARLPRMPPRAVLDKVTLPKTEKAPSVESLRRRPAGTETRQ